MVALLLGLQFIYNDIRLPPLGREIPVVYIIVDDEFESRILKSELTRDWDSYGLYHFQRFRDDMLVEKFVFIDAEDHAQYHKYHVRGNYVKFPVYRLRSAGKFKEFPRSTFSCMTWPLLTMGVILNREEEAHVRYYHQHPMVWNDSLSMKIAYARQFWKDNCLQWHPGLERPNWKHYTIKFATDEHWASWTYVFLPDLDILEEMPGWNPPLPPELPLIDFPWENP